MTHIDILFDISDRVGGEKKYEYFMLHHKKHNRTICFKDTPEAIEFIQSKFRHSLGKRFVHWMIRRGMHRWFFDTIVLSQDLGDVIYIANSVKSFDLEKKEVLVFRDDKELLLTEVVAQALLAKKGFAPKVLAVSESCLYFKEELLYDAELLDEEIADKLAAFHKYTEYQYIHGDFVKDHIKVDNERNIKFIDWNLKKGNPTEDMKNFIERSQ